MKRPAPKHKPGHPWRVAPAVHRFYRKRARK